MTSPASKPGRWLSQLAYRLQSDVEKGIVDVRSQVDHATEGHSAMDQFERSAGHFALGVAHGVLGMANGVVNGLGWMEQAVTDPAFDASVVKTAQDALSHPVESGQKLTAAIERAFQQDGAYSAGDFATLLIPAAAGLAVGGPIGAVGGFVLGGLAAAASPQPPLAIDQPDLPKKG